MTSLSNSEPIVLLCTRCTYGNCSDVGGFWDDGSENSVVSTLKTIYSNIRTVVVNANNDGTFDEHKWPKDLIRYGKWFPMILLVPGQLWDNAMSRLGPNNDIQLIEGVQIMNGYLVDGVLKYHCIYDITKASEFGRWFQTAINATNIKNFSCVPISQSSPMSNTEVKELTSNSLIVKLEGNISVLSCLVYNKQPNKGQGNILFKGPLNITLKPGTQFKRKCIPGVIFTLGNVGSSISIVDDKITIPAGSMYIEKDTKIGIWQPLPCSQEFYLEPGVSVVLPANTKFHIGNEEESFLQDTCVELV